jgi:hypothetical protein
MKTAMVFLLLTVFSAVSFAQDQYLILNHDMPTFTEGASTLPQNEIQWGLGGSPGLGYNGSSYAQIHYGLLNNLQAHIQIGSGSADFVEGLSAGLKYNFNPTEKIFPLISLSAQYVSRSWSANNIFARAIATKSFGNFRTHANISSYCPYEASERIFDMGVAFDYNFSEQKLLVVGEVVANNFSNLRYLYRIGAKKQFGDSFLIYGAVGAALNRNFNQTKEFSVGINWYGFDWIGE